MLNLDDFREEYDEAVKKANEQEDREMRERKAQRRFPRFSMSFAFSF